MIPYYIYIPVSDNEKGAALTGPEFVGLIIFIVILAAWTLAVIILFQDLMFDDNKQGRKRHTIELIVLIAIGVIWLIAC